MNRFTLRVLSGLSACLGIGGTACGGLVELDSEVILGGGGAASTGAGAGTGGAAPTGGGPTGSGGGAPASGGFGGTGGVSFGAGGTVDLAADPQTFCKSVCASAVPNSCMACEPAFCPIEAANWDVSVRRAFAECAAAEPLCFRSPEACMLDVLFPPETATRHHILQISFLEGQAPYHVRAGAMPSSLPVDMTAQGISSEDHLVFGWDHGWDSDIGPTFYVWLDLDRDGLCESGDDRFGVAGATWNRSFHPPYYIAEMTSYIDRGEAACPILGFEDVGQSDD